MALLNLSELFLLSEITLYICLPSCLLSSSSLQVIDSRGPGTLFVLFAAVTHASVW
jgi:hypothetical protein